MVKVKTNTVESLDLETTIKDTTLVSQSISIATANILYANTLDMKVFTLEEIVRATFAVDILIDNGLNADMETFEDILIGILQEKGHSLEDSILMQWKYAEKCQQNKIFADSLDEAVQIRREELDGRFITYSIKGEKIFIKYDDGSVSKFDFSSMLDRLKQNGLCVENGRIFQVIKQSSNTTNIAQSIWNSLQEKPELYLTDSSLFIFPKEDRAALYFASQYQMSGHSFEEAKEQWNILVDTINQVNENGVVKEAPEGFSYYESESTKDKTWI